MSNLIFFTNKLEMLPSSGGKSTKFGAGVGDSAAIGPLRIVCDQGFCSNRALIFQSPKNIL